MNAPVPPSRITAGQPAGLGLTIAFALRNLRHGLRGFGVFLACIALGVGAITGVGSVARALGDGLASQGRLILGGDVSASLLQREATPEEIAWLRGRGQMHAVATLRAMVRTADGRSALVEPKAVAEGYPAVGSIEFSPPLALDQVLAKDGAAYGAAADEVLFARLGLKPGDRLRIGEADIVLRAVLVSEPDKLAAGIGFGPRLILSQEALRASGLLAPGSLVRWTYRVSLPAGQSDDAGLTRFADDLARDLPESGFEVRSRVNAAPQFSRNVERFAQYLTLSLIHI